MKPLITTINLIEFIKEIYLKHIFIDVIEELSLSELMIHKILYVVYGNFYARFQKPLFKDAKFEAWQYGPVEIDFKHQYQSRLANDKFNVHLTSEQKDFLFKLIERLLKLSPWTITHYSWSTDPWLTTADAKNKSISNNQIYHYFTKNPLMI